MSEQKPRKIVRTAEYLEKFSHQRDIEAVLRIHDEQVADWRKTAVDAAKTKDISHLTDLLRDGKYLNKSERELIAELLEKAYLKGPAKRRQERLRITAALYWLGKEMQKEPAVAMLVESLGWSRSKVYRRDEDAGTCSECQSLIETYDSFQEKGEHKLLVKIRCLDLDAVGVSHEI